MTEAVSFSERCLWAHRATVAAREAEERAEGQAEFDRLHEELRQRLKSIFDVDLATVQVVRQGAFPFAEFDGFLLTVGDQRDTLALNRRCSACGEPNYRMHVRDEGGIGYYLATYGDRPFLCDPCEIKASAKDAPPPPTPAQVLVAALDAYIAQALGGVFAGIEDLHESVEAAAERQSAALQRARDEARREADRLRGMVAELEGELDRTRRQATGGGW